MARAKRQGWTSWERYKECGVVEETVAFTDEPVIVAHALGKTESIIGEAWPIDAAVAYTLVSHGPDAALTWDDFVNQNTRLATVMMSGKVGYCKEGVANPNILDCGHDLVDCFINSFPQVGKNAKGHLDFLHNGKKLIFQEWFVDAVASGSIPESTAALAQFRDDRKHKAHQSIFHPEFAPLREAIEGYFDATTWQIPRRVEKLGSDEAMPSEKTKGTCAWKDEPEKICSHHDGAYTSGWVLIKKEIDGQPANAYEQFWVRGKGTVVSHNWNEDHLQQHFGWNYKSSIGKERVVVFDMVKRSLAQSVSDAAVIEQVKDSLNRMRKWDGRCLVHKEGRGRTSTHRWNNWNWLGEMVTWVQDTLSKNRKEDETQCCTCYAAGVEDEEGNSYCDCNQGWRYVKYDSRMSYGHEIAKFEWRPIESPKAFSLRIGSKYSGVTLPYRFRALEQANTFRQFLNQMVDKVGGKHRSRTWDEAAGAEVINAKANYKIVSLSTKLSMKWSKDPEELPTPQQSLDAVLYGTPFERAQAEQHLKVVEVGNENPSLTIVNEPTPLAEESENNE